MEELTLLLEQLAAQMNTTVEFLWGVMVRQAQIEVIKYFVFLAAIIIFAIVMYNIAIRYTQANQEDDVEGVKLIIKIIFGVIIFFYITIEGSYKIDALLNPEYWALQQILEYVK